MLADYLVVDVTKPYAEQGSFLEIELAARRGEPHETCGGRALNDDVMDTIFTQLINAGNGPVDPRRRRPRRRGPPSRTFPVPGAAEPGPARASRAPLAIEWRDDAVTATDSSSLELDDIQGGALHERPSPVRRHLPAAAHRRPRRRPRAGPAAAPASSTPAARRPTRRADAWITVAFTYHGLKALGVPQASLDSFAPEFRQGMAARAAELGDVGESSPEHWEKPLGTADVHVALGGALARRRAAGGGRRAGTPRARGARRASS